MSYLNPDPHKDGFASRPTHRITGFINDLDDAQAAVEALNAAGFADDKLMLFMGDEGLKRLDYSGRDHGLRGRLTRLMQNIGEETQHFQEAERELQAGHIGIGVLTDGSEAQRAAAQRALKAHNARSLRYWGDLTHEDLP